VVTGLLSGTDVQDAYPDITSGSQVIVTDSSGTVIGTGMLSYDKAKTFALTTGTAVILAKKTGASASGIASALSQDVAIYDFSVSGLPGGLVRYGIKVGHNRGTIWFTAAQMKAGPGLTLGSLS